MSLLIKNIEFLTSRCQVCVSSGGAMKMIDSNAEEWIHLCCLLGCSKYKIESVDSLKIVQCPQSQTKKSSSCSVCGLVQVIICLHFCMNCLLNPLLKKKKSICLYFLQNHSIIACAYPNCKKGFHFRCARKIGCLIAIYMDSPIKILCMSHSKASIWVSFIQWITPY